MISIVTPSLNQGGFLETAIRSVLSQEAEVEYVIMDGGSTDGSVEIVRRHEPSLAAWRSEPDGGQYDALNKGFALTTGGLMGWLNADDFYLPGCLALVESVFATHPEIDWITTTTVAIANEHGQVYRTISAPRLSREAFRRGFNVPLRGTHGGHFIPQESTFWRRSLWERAGGGLDASLALAGDVELWARFFEHAELWGIRALLGAYRSQPAQKTSLAMHAYLAEAEGVLERSGARRYGRAESRLRARLSPSLTSRRLWRVPAAARAGLVERGLLYRTPELLWSPAARAWVVNDEYFV
jgi:glycosyltransferase involved in cell wall biosynthesis